MRMATCHTTRPHFAKGLCSPCYQAEYRKVWIPKTTAKCHPERAHKCRGLCSACYQKYKAAPGWIATGRPARQNTCGHPDKRHSANGMCGGCSTRARRDKNREADSIARKDYQLRATYGITLVTFNAMFENQGSACALCEKAIQNKRHRHVDHCHETGAVRGILCFACNRSLGILGDTPEAIARALAYVSGERIAAKAGVFIPMGRAA